MNGVGEQIVMLYSWIRGVACRLSPSAADGEDLAHDTIIKALLNADHYDGVRDIKPWLMTILLNTLKSRLRHGGCVPMCPMGDDWERYGYDDVVARYELQSLVAALRQMAATDNGVRSLWLYAFGYDYGEIAALTGVDIGTVKSRMHYARKRLKKLLNA